MARFFSASFRAGNLAAAGPANTGGGNKGKEARGGDTQAKLDAAKAEREAMQKKNAEIKAAKEAKAAKERFRFLVHHSAYVVLHLHALSHQYPPGSSPHIKIKTCALLEEKERQKKIAAMGK